MMDLETSAPGKAVIAGEYAVLAGAPAISMAINRRAHVRIRETEDSSHCVSAPGYLEGSFRFSVTPEAGIVWLDELPSTNAFALFEAVWKQSGMTQRNGLSLVLDTAEFLDAASGLKLGLGSSAALATALAAALANLQSGPVSIDALAASAHLDFQRGSGSGIDIATAVHGGVIEFQVGARPVSLPWPKDLAYRLFWSGEAVSTTGKLDRLAKSISLPSRDRLITHSRNVTAAWKAGSITRLLSELQHYIQALQEFSIDHELGIFEAGHQELAAKAKTYPKTVYKPCGAGGGDIGIVLAESLRDIDRFTADAVSCGFMPLDTSLDSAGVLVAGRSPC